MPRGTRAYLWDALRAAGLPEDFTRGKSFSDYEADDMLKSAVERQFEIIGEALNQLSPFERCSTMRVQLRATPRLRSVSTCRVW
jgi:uncharacterized protein with HEPN domain